MRLRVQSIANHRPMTQRTSSTQWPVSRRSILAALPATAGLLAAAGWPAAAAAAGVATATTADPPPSAPAETPAAPPQPTNGAGQPFSFDGLSEAMRQRALAPYRAPAKPAIALGDLGYDDYRLIQFNPRRSLWNEPGSFFRLDAFHLGWLFDTPVTLYEVVDGRAREIVFTTDDFTYHGDLAARVTKKTPLAGVAGFRLRFPLNRADIFDELVAFVGASYFRALGEGSTYGLSARGLAINTALSGNEEFPRFFAFYLERPAPGAQQIVVNAALDSPSVTGAYRFVISPGRVTEMAVTARLYFRAAVQQLGVAPLTSMYLYSATNRASFDDYRPQVHDSDGLAIRRADGDRMWRALANPPRLGSSVFTEAAPRSFGLHQRARGFELYQDAGAHYETRPSLDVVPQGDWGRGAVRLVEIPSQSEANDNIAAFWVPADPIKAGDARSYAYQLAWGELAPDGRGELAHVIQSRAGHGGFSGSKPDPALRKFVIDFGGGQLARMPPDSTVEAVVTASGGKIVNKTLFKLTGRDMWRLALDVSAKPAAVVEMTAHIAGYGRKLSEIWLYQWMRH